MVRPNAALISSILGSCFLINIAAYLTEQETSREMWRPGKDGPSTVLLCVPLPVRHIHYHLVFMGVWSSTINREDGGSGLLTRLAGVG